MKRVLFILAALLPLIATAETKEQRLESRHEIRIGIGDPIIARAWIGSGAGWGGASNYDLWARTFGQNVYASHKFYSFEDFQKQLAVWQYKYNDFPMRPLNWRSPRQVLASFPNV